MTLMGGYKEGSSGCKGTSGDNGGPRGGERYGRMGCDLMLSILLIGELVGLTLDIEQSPGATGTSLEMGDSKQVASLVTGTLELWAGEIVVELQEQALRWGAPRKGSLRLKGHFYWLQGTPELG